MRFRVLVIAVILLGSFSAEANRAEIARVLVEHPIAQAYLQTAKGARVIERVMGRSCQIRTQQQVKDFVKSFRNHATDDLITDIVADLKYLLDTVPKIVPTLRKVDRFAALSPSGQYDAALHAIANEGRFSIANPNRVFPQDITPSFADKSVSRFVQQRRVFYEGKASVQPHLQTRLKIATPEQTDRLYELSRASVFRTSAKRDHVAAYADVTPIGGQKQIIQGTSESSVAKQMGIDADPIRIRAEFSVQKEAVHRVWPDDRSQMRRLIKDEKIDASLDLTVSGDLGAFNMLLVKVRKEAIEVSQAVKKRGSDLRAKYAYFYERIVGSDGQVFYVLARSQQVKQSISSFGYDLNQVTVEFRVIKAQDTTHLKNAIR